MNTIRNNRKSNKNIAYSWFSVKCFACVILLKKKKNKSFDTQLPCLMHLNSIGVWYHKPEATLTSKNRMVSRPGISENLEKPGNFVALEKSRGISWNQEKSVNFNVKLGKVREFYLHETIIAEVQNSFQSEQELVMPVHI